MTTAALLPEWDPRWALFLDVDGTLVDIEGHPDNVRAGRGLKAALGRIARALGSSLALVSGRSIASLDRMFAPMVLPAAGLHGLERRGANGKIHSPEGIAGRMRDARDRLAPFVESRAGLLLEDKGAALALHFRNAPELEPAARVAMQGAAPMLGDDFHVQQGKMVLELKPAGGNKGTAIRAFMAEPPFAGRIPVFIGDDVTDEDGFHVVNELGGHSVRVGPPAATDARFRVAGVTGVVNQMETWAQEAANHED